MARRPRAVIDIGSNTVLLTAGELDEKHQLNVLLELHDVARLGEGLEDGKPLNPSARARVLKVLKNFQKQSLHFGIHDIQAAGTAAFRRASDGQEFALEISRLLNIPCRILSGDQEAHFSFQSAKRDFSNGPIGMIDIGGGSTEVVMGQESQGVSLPLGTVSLLEKWVEHQPIGDDIWQNIKLETSNLLKKYLVLPGQRELQWIAVAATPTALACLLQKLPEFKPDLVHGYPIQVNALEEILETLRQLNLKEREQLPGMQAKRAELLPLGGLILLQILKHVGAMECRASHHGLRYGILWEALERA